MVKSWIFLLFFHQVIEGKYKGSLGAYIEEKKTLRRIAALNQIYGEHLTWQVVEQKLKDFESTDNNESKLKQVSRSQYFFYLRPTTKGEIIDFVHKTFKEYLLAEYYIESLLKNKVYRLNARTPTYETILFLDGLIELLLETEDESVKKYIAQDQISLLKSFEYNKGQDSAIKELEDITLTTVEDESIIFFGTNNDVKDKNKTENIWRQVIISSKDYEHLLMHKWISLYILKKLNPAKNPNKEKLANLIRFSGILIPGYMKNLSRAELSNTKLQNVNLSYADLTGAILRNTDLSNADLSYTDLTGADLSNASIYGICLRNAKMIHADLYLAYPIDANLRNANLSGARLDGDEAPFEVSGDLRGANFSGAYLLGGLGFHDTNMTNAKFSSARISQGYVAKTAT